MPSAHPARCAVDPSGLLLGAALAAALLSSLVACGGGGNGHLGTGGAGGAGHATGGAGGVSPGGSAKPTCADTGGPSGPTPVARADTAGVLGPDGRTFLLYGGDTAVPVCGGIPSHAHVGDTWLLDAGCGTWKEITASPSPGTRARHSMALDAAHGRALLFGGRTRTGGSGPYTLFADVWAFDFKSSAWSQLATTGAGPSGRSNAAIAVSGDKLIVFGGNTSTSGLSFNPQSDAYAMDLASGAWTKLAPSGPPTARLFHAMAADPVAHRVYVHAGGDANAFQGPFFADLWALDLDAMSWTDLHAKNGGDGTGRIKLGLAATVGKSGTAVYAFGGHDDGALGNRNDVLSIDLSAASPAWAAVQQGDVPGQPATGPCTFPPDFTTEDMKSPERRSAFAFGARADGAAFVVVGGDSDCGVLGDAWWFDAAVGAWTPIRQTLVGLTCLRTGSSTCSGLCG